MNRTALGHQKETDTSKQLRSVDEADSTVTFSDGQKSIQLMIASTSLNRKMSRFCPSMVTSLPE